MVGHNNTRLCQQQMEGTFSASVHGSSPFDLPNFDPVHTNDVAGRVQKQYLIFDHSNNQTRVFISPLFRHHENPGITPEKSIHAFDPFDEEQKIMINGDKNENEMREDSEEIDALLYSDDSYDDDEVMSTGRSPFEGKTEEFASFDGSTKRQRLLDGGYKKTSLADTASSSKRDGLCNEGQFRREKIHDTLRILQNMVPDVESDDPFLVIDEAIKYLKSLKD